MKTYEYRIFKEERVPVVVIDDGRVALDITKDFKLETTTAGKHKCPMCHYKNYTLRGINTHMQEFHDYCAQCDKWFASLNKHRAKVHS